MGVFVHFSAVSHHNVSAGTPYTVFTAAYLWSLRHFHHYNALTMLAMRKVVLGSFLLWAVSGRHTQNVSWLIFTVTKMKTEGDNSAKTGKYGTLRVIIKMV